MIVDVYKRQTYTYVAGNGRGKTTPLVESVTNGTQTLYYTYDGLGNITHIHEKSSDAAAKTEKVRYTCLLYTSQLSGKQTITVLGAVEGMTGKAYFSGLQLEAGNVANKLDVYKRQALYMEYVVAGKL